LSLGIADVFGGKYKYICIRGTQLPCDNLALDGESPEIPEEAVQVAIVTTQCTTSALL
jgi:hypothetical protein